MSVEFPLLPCPVEAGLAPLHRRLRRERSRPRERLLPRPKASPRIPFALYLVASLIEVAPGVFRVVLLRGVIPEERHQAVPESLQHMPDKADHGLRHFIEVGVDQVRQSSASSFEAMPVEPTRSEHDRERGVHERWLRGAQSPRVNSELPNLTRQSTQRRAGVDPEARVSRSIQVRKECAKSGRSRIGH